MVTTFWQTFWSCYQWLSAQHEDNLGNQPLCSNHVVDFAAFIFCLHPTCYPSQLALGKWRDGSWRFLMVPDHPDVTRDCNGWIWTKQRWFLLQIAPNQDTLSSIVFFYQCQSHGYPMQNVSKSFFNWWNENPKTLSHLRDHPGAGGFGAIQLRWSYVLTCCWTNPCQCRKSHKAIKFI